MLIQLDWSNSALSPVVHGDIALRIHTIQKKTQLYFEETVQLIAQCH